MVTEKDMIRRLSPTLVEPAGAESQQDQAYGDARVIGEYLSRDPLHNIYLIHALARMLSARAAHPEGASGPASGRPIDMSGFWGAFAETPADPGDPAPDASSGPDAPSGSAHCGASAPSQMLHPDKERLEGLLLIEPRDRPGSHRHNNCVGYLAHPAETTGLGPDQAPGPDEASGPGSERSKGSTGNECLACLGRFAAQSGVRTLIGHRSSVEPAVAGLLRVQARLLHFYRADPERLVRSYDYPVRRATEDDIPELVELYRGYEFSRRDTTDDDIRREIEQAMNQSGVYFCVEAPDSPEHANRVSGARRIVSGARVYPETDDAGLIGAARTLPEYRGHGIYLAVRTACFEYLFAQDKAGLGMFLDTNTSMHQVIQKQGGTILAEWLIADLQPRPSRALVHLRHRLVPSQIRQWAIRCKTIFSGECTHNDT